MFPGVGLVLKPFLTGALAFLRGLPWQLWASLALLALGLFYGHLRYNAGQADIQTKFDAYQSRMIAATDAAKAAAKRAETLSRTAMDAALVTREQGLKDAKATEAAVAAGIRAGTLKLRKHWQGCPAGVPQAAGDPGERDEAAELRAADTGTLVGIGAKADADVTYWQGVARANPQCLTVTP